MPRFTGVHTFKTIPVQFASCEKSEETSQKAHAKQVRHVTSRRKTDSADGSMSMKTGTCRRVITKISEGGPEDIRNEGEAMEWPSMTEDGRRSEHVMRVIERP